MKQVRKYAIGVKGVEAEGMEKLMGEKKRSKTGSAE